MKRIELMQYSNSDRFVTGEEQMCIVPLLWGSLYSVSNLGELIVQNMALFVQRKKSDFIIRMKAQMQIKGPVK